jgi:hypothetical protein
MATKFWAMWLWEQKTISEAAHIIFKPTINIGRENL